MKMLVETTGDFLLVDYSQDVVIESDRPTVVENSTFVQTAVSRRQLRVLGELKNDATNEALQETFAGSKDVTVATEAFLAEFNPQPVTKNAKRP